MPDSAWSLHPQLEKDTIDIGDLPLSRVLVIRDANYPWLLLVPRRPDTVEIIDLDEVRQTEYRSTRQRRAAASCPYHRAPHQRRRLAAAGLGRGAGTSP